MVTSALMKRAQPVILVIFSFVALMTVARNPRLDTFHTVDVLGLMASGMCFGVAIALTLRALRMGRFK